MRARFGLVISIFLMRVFSPLSFAQQALQTLPQPTNQGQPSDRLVAHSKVHTAWLTEVRGEAALARNAGDVLQKAFSNSPVPEESRVQTGVGRAEIEFVGGSAIRLASYSAVEFRRIDLLPSGTTASTVRILKGTVYISLMPSYLMNTKGNEINVIFGERNLHLQPSSHVRIELDDAKARLALLDGPGQIETPSGPVKLRSNRTIVYDPASPQFVVNKKIEHRPFDNWDRAELEREHRAMNWENRIVRHYNQSSIPIR